MSRPSTPCAAPTRTANSNAGSPAIAGSTTSCAIGINPPAHPREPTEAPLAGAFGRAWRRYWIDVLASLVLFVLAAIAAGRIWRFPVADEIATIVPLVPSAARSSTWALARFYLQGGDIHPPTTFVFFSTLYDLGVGEAALHLCGLAMTAAALALWQLLTLALIGRQNEGAVGPITRLVSVLLFGLTALAIGQGELPRCFSPPHCSRHARWCR